MTDKDKPKPAPSRQPKPSISSVSEMLTPSELASLRQDAKEASDYARKAFAHLRPKVALKPEK